MTSSTYGSLFDGVLIYDVESIGTIPGLSSLDIINMIGDILMKAGVLVFLELQPPKYCIVTDELDGDVIKEELDFEKFHGIVLVNVTQDEFGGLKDYFDIDEEFWMTVKKYTSQIAIRTDFCVMILEMFESNTSTESLIPPCHVTRLLKLSQFYKAIPWMIHYHGLYNIESNRKLIRPINFLNLMSSDTYQRVVALWKGHLKNETIKLDHVDDGLYETRETCDDEMSLLKLLNIENQLTNFHRVAIHPSSPSTRRFGYELLNIHPDPPLPNLTLNLPCQHSLQSTPSESDYTKVLNTQHRLLKRGLLEPLSTEGIEEICHVMQTVAGNRDHENVVCMIARTTLDRIRCGSLKVFVCLDTGFCLYPSGSHMEDFVHFWAVWGGGDSGDSGGVGVGEGEGGVDVDVNGSDVICFVSKKHPRIVEAVWMCSLQVHGYPPHRLNDAQMCLPIISTTGLPMFVEFDLADASVHDQLTILHGLNDRNSIFAMLVSNEIRKRLLKKDPFCLEKCTGWEWIFEDGYIQRAVEHRKSWYLHIAQYRATQASTTTLSLTKNNTTATSSSRENSPINTKPVPRYSNLFPMSKFPSNPHFSMDSGLGHSDSDKSSDGDSIYVTEMDGVVQQIPVKSVSCLRNVNVVEDGSGAGGSGDIYFVEMFSEREFKGMVTGVEGVVRRWVLDNKVDRVRAVLEKLGSLLSKGQIGQRVDLVAFAFFMAFKREAYDEGLMSELYVLGTRCDIFFDIPIDSLSRLLHKQRMAHLQSNPPPPSRYHPRKFMFTYRPLIHCGPMSRTQTKSSSSSRSLSSVSSSLVFAVPAILDLVLLMGTGHGIFLNVQMGSGERKYLSVALLVSLLCSGCLGPAISEAGSYYFYLYQFPTMAYVMVKHFAGAILLIFLVSCAIAVDIFFDQSYLGAGEFLLFTCLYSLVIQVAFWGVYVMIWLFLVKVYLERLSGWLREVKQTSEKEVTQWYTRKYGQPQSQVLINRKSTYINEIAREQLEREIKQFKLVSRKISVDPFVERLAKSYGMTSFLLQWHSHHMGYDMPEPYGSEWNLNFKLAVQDMEKINKAGKVNRPRLFWHGCKFEMGFMFFYLILLLLDRWVVLFTGGRLLSLITIENTQNGYGQGSALLFYLLSIVVLEAVSFGIWPELEKLKDDETPLRDKTAIRNVLQSMKSRKSALYRKYGSLVTGCTLIIFAVVGVFLWNFASSWNAVWAYGGFSLGYACLVLITFNKIFIAKNSKSLFFSVFVGAVLGVAGGMTGRILFPDHYIEEAAQVVGSLIAASLTCCFVMSGDGISAGFQVSERMTNALSTGQHFIGDEGIPTIENDVKLVVHGSLVDDLKMNVDVGSPLGIAVVLAVKHRLEVAVRLDESEAIPDLSHYVGALLSVWKHDSKIHVSLVPASTLQSLQMCSVALKDENGVTSMYIGLDLDVSEFKTPGILAQHIAADFEMVPRIAEAFVHEGLEVYHELDHSDAMVAEFLMFKRLKGLPVRILAQLEASSDDKLWNVMARTKRELAKDLAFGCVLDRDWVKVESDDVRQLLLEQVAGRSEMIFSTYDLDAQVQDQFNKPMDQLTWKSLVSCNMTLEVCRAAYEILNKRRGQSPILAPPPSDTNDFVAFSKQHKPSLITKFTHTMDRFGQIVYHICLGDSGLSREIMSNNSGLVKSSAPYLTDAVALFFGRMFRVFGNRFAENMLWSKNPLLSVLKNFQSRGITRVVTENYVQYHSPLQPETAFLHESRDNVLIYHHYRGILDKTPFSRKLLIRVSEFDLEYKLLRQELWKNLNVHSVVEYVYAESSNSHDQNGMFPVKKTVTMSMEGWVDEFFYDGDKGRVVSAKLRRQDTEFDVTYTYVDYDLTETTYESSNYILRVSWAITTSSSAVIPTGKVQSVHYESKYANADGSYTKSIATWTYLVNSPPEIITIETTTNTQIPTPEFIKTDIHGLLKLPDRLYFTVENLMFLERLRVVQSKAGWSFSRLIGNWERGDDVEVRFNTAKARTALWKVWLSTNLIDGVWAQAIDEHLLRSEPRLKKYWYFRDHGYVHRALQSLTSESPHHALIESTIHIDEEVSSKTHMAISLSDLNSFSRFGGESHVTSTQPREGFGACQELQMKREDVVNVFGLATGTWPTSSGGVSNCFRDLVDNLKEVRWNILAETAHEMETILPQFQIHRNVDTLLLLPLWGFDHLDCQNNFAAPRPDKTIESSILRTTPPVITYFISRFLTQLIHLCSTQSTPPTHLNRATLQSALRMFVDFYDFFQVFDYNTVWGSVAVKSAWVRLWVGTGKSDDGAGCLMDVEMHTLSSALNTLSYLIRTLFCLTVKMPEQPPDLIQTSHHAIGSIYAVVMKAKLGVTLHVWDHGILWREYLGHWSGAESTYRPSLHNSLLGLARLISTLTLTYADAILPCTSFSNPIWEIYRGTDGSNLTNKLMISRKIEPAVNGIVELDDFFPDYTAESLDLTVVMLSHIVTFKDIKNAILAADVIVNQFGIRGYKLDIYGSTDKIPWYTCECQNLIVVSGLQDNVKIRGFGDSKYVLNSAWLVLNSSIAEGLPLALGEAGLSGQPIVCTEAGGSRQVIQDRNGTILGRVVPPGSPYELAIAQLTVLGLFDGLEDVGCGGNTSGGGEVVRLEEWISEGRFAEVYARILSVRELRRKLGVRFREHVLDKFSGERYLREHGQFIWIGSMQTRSSGGKQLDNIVTVL
ncbi:hypothetical protein HDU76_007000 [Blyttiomyces sp. JEL0837]|nr:hypothetical protein HDU76_007000 [Blyttiomyces sp. JEL0837]